MSGSGYTQIVLFAVLFALVGYFSKPDDSAAIDGPVTLRYFKSRGRAETIRLFLELTGTEYTDIQFTGDEWRGENGIKQEGTEKGWFKFGQVPQLSIGDKHFVQAHAILRHLARGKGMYGKNNYEQTQCDIIAMGVDDIRQKYSKVAWSDDFEGLKVELIEKTLPLWLGHFEKILNENDPENLSYFVGDSRTWADIVVFEFLETILNPQVDAKAIDKFAGLQSFMKSIQSNPNFIKYNESGRRNALRDFSKK